MKLLNYEKLIFLKPLFTAILFASFIYLEYFEIPKNHFFYLISSIISIISLYFLFNLTKKELAFFGFFTGVLWFYWISLSFRYYDLVYLIPLIIAFLGVAYSLFFYFMGYFRSIWVKFFIFLAIAYLEPFGFNWFKPQIININSYFGTEFWQLIWITFIIVLILQIKDRFGSKSFLLLFLLIFSTNDFSELIKETNHKIATEEEINNLKVSIIETKVHQKDKWLLENEIPIVKMNLNLIRDAINQKKKIVVLPESTFPMFLNEYPQLIEHLKLLSHSITIWAGSLYNTEENIFNSTYIFQNGKLEIAQKMVLVPFGEYLPLPKFIRDWINQTFFDGANDFSTADKPVDIKINNINFRHAICYEATSSKLYEHDPKYMIVISNNGWFVPSIEPTLQKILMQHYSNVHKTTIFHSANMQGSTIIKPQTEQKIAKIF